MGHDTTVTSFFPISHGEEEYLIRLKIATLMKKGRIQVLCDMKVHDVAMALHDTYLPTCLFLSGRDFRFSLELCKDITNVFRNIEAISSTHL